jgi:hypothetical protein
MMINGFMPRMPLLPSSVNSQRSLAPPTSNLLPSPLFNGLNGSASMQSGFPGTITPSFNMGSWLNPGIGNVMGSASQFGSRMMGGLGNALSGLGSGIGQLGLMGMPGLPGLNSLFAPQQPQPVSPMAGIRPARQQPIFQSLSQGAGQALKDLGSFAKNNAPAALAMGGAMVGGGAVCAFMGGAMAATSGIILGNQAMQSSSHPV